MVDLAEEQAEHHAGCAGEGGADEERRRDHAVGVDAHHRGGLAVERDGAHRLPEPRPADEREQREHQENRPDDHDQAEVLDEDTVVAAEVDAVVADQVETVVVAELRAEQQQRRVLEEERDAERGDQRGDPRRVAQRPVGEALDREAEQPRAEHRDDEHAGHQQRDRDRRVQRAAQERQHAEADEGADHVDVAVGEVQELQDPVDHRVAQRDQRVEAAEDDPVDGQLEEEGPALGRGQVDRVEHEGDQRQRQPGQVAEPLSQSRIHAVPNSLRVTCGPPGWATRSFVRNARLSSRSA